MAPPAPPAFRTALGAPNGSVRFRWVKAPTSTELTDLAYTMAQRLGRFLARQGVLESDTEDSYLAGEAAEVGPLDQLLARLVATPSIACIFHGPLIFVTAPN